MREWPLWGARCCRAARDSACPARRSANPGCSHACLHSSAPKHRAPRKCAQLAPKMQCWLLREGPAVPRLAQHFAARSCVLDAPFPILHGMMLIRKQGRKTKAISPQLKKKILLKSISPSGRSRRLLCATPAPLWASGTHTLFDLIPQEWQGWPFPASPSLHQS